MGATRKSGTFANIYYTNVRYHDVRSEPQREKTYLLTCAPNEDSNQPMNPHIPIWVFLLLLLLLFLCVCVFFCFVFFLFVAFFFFFFFFFFCFFVRVMKLCILGYPNCVCWRFWTDCANAQADLNLQWAQISVCWPCGSYHLSQRTKPTIRLVRPAKTQISLRIRAVWSESSLIACAFHCLQAIQRGIN